MPGRDLEITPRPPDPAADLATVDGVVASMDLSVGDHPLLPLAYLLQAQELPTVDRLLVVDGLRLDAVNIARTGTCVELRSLYRSADEEIDTDTQALVVRQARGCTLRFADTVGDTAWYASVPAEWAERAHWLRFDSVESLDPGGRDLNPELWLETWQLDNPTIPVVASFEWQNGLVAVTDPHPEFLVERYSNPLVITPLPSVSGGGSGSGCEAYGWHTSSNDGVGFLLVVAELPGLEFEFEPPLDVVLTPIDEAGRAAAVVDIAGIGGPRLVTVLDANGDSVPCVQ